MSRTYRDPIHYEIKLNSGDPVENLLIELIDSKEVQRLRWIRQLGTSWFTFHGAEHSRFPHSLGAMHVARLMFNRLESTVDYSLENDRAPVLCAALLHDIGHGPFSHSCEKIIDTCHERWTHKLLLADDSEVNSILKRFDRDLPEKVVAILNKTYPRRFLCNIVSSQLDCDRFDYLLRDSHMTGTAYGNFDLNRVISSIKVNQKNDCIVVFGDKGMLAVEDYLYARYSMHLQVYHHKKSLATDTLLQKLFKRLKALITAKKVHFIEKEVYNWVTDPLGISVKDFLAIDDVNLMHHMKHWVNERDLILRDLAGRFMRRKLFKSTKIGSNTNSDQLFLSKQEDLKARGLSSDYYLEKVTIDFDPYKFYTPDRGDFSKAIMVEDNDGNLHEISEVSNVVGALVKGDYQHSWLVSV